MKAEQFFYNVEGRSEPFILKYGSCGAWQPGYGFVYVPDMPMRAEYLMIVPEKLASQATLERMVAQPQFWDEVRAQAVQIIERTAWCDEEWRPWSDVQIQVYTYPDASEAWFGRARGVIPNYESRSLWFVMPPSTPYKIWLVGEDVANPKYLSLTWPFLYLPGQASDKKSHHWWYQEELFWSQISWSFFNFGEVVDYARLCRFISSFDLTGQLTAEGKSVPPDFFRPLQARRELAQWRSLPWWRKLF